MIGHNQPSFDQIVEENLLRGLYLSQLNAMTRAVKDPRLSARHAQVLATIIERTNSKTGMSYPGRARLAQDITYYVEGEPKHYSEASIASAIYDLTECGYIMAAKRAPVGGGRALSHYVTVAPAIDDLQAQITEWCVKVRGQPKRERPAHWRTDVDTNINVKNAGENADVDAAINVEATINLKSDVDAAAAADVDTAFTTVTGKRTGKEIGGGDFFEAFWQAFPKGRKQAKGEARLVFERIISGKHKVGFATPAELIEGAKRYAASKPDPDYTPMPTSWLNQGRWLDDLPAAVVAKWWQSPEKVQAMTLDRWERGIAQYAQDFWSIEQLGPPPGSAGCVVAPEFIKQLKLTELYDHRGLKR